LEDNVADPEKIDILCAIQMVVRAWTYEVKPETIFNYFHHCKIHSTEEPVVDASEECPLDPEVIKTSSRKFGSSTIMTQWTSGIC
jgi:hypothetical protein